MLQAMNTGHEGSMTTIHANNARDALGRLEVMIAHGRLRHSRSAASATQIASALQHRSCRRSSLAPAARKVAHVSEITGMEGDQIQMHDLFLFEQTGVDENGHATGHFLATGIRPRFSQRIEHAGMHVPPEWFTPGVIRIMECRTIKEKAERRNARQILRSAFCILTSAFPFTPAALA